MNEYIYSSYFDTECSVSDNQLHKFKTIENIFQHFQPNSRIYLLVSRCNAAVGRAACHIDALMSSSSLCTLRSRMSRRICAMDNRCGITQMTRYDTPVSGKNCFSLCARSSMRFIMRVMLGKARKGAYSFVCTPRVRTK